MRLILGVDPGLRGGLALLGPLGTPTVEPMPLRDGAIDPAEVTRLVRAWGPDLAVIERALSMPSVSEDGEPRRKMGAASAMTAGIGWGLVRGVLAGLGVPCVVVDPVRWQGHVWAGELIERPTGRTDRKALLAEIACRRWPLESFKPPGYRLPHSGMCEAALIARWGQCFERTLIAELRARGEP